MGSAWLQIPPTLKRPGLYRHGADVAFALLVTEGENVGTEKCVAVPSELDVRADNVKLEGAFANLEAE